MSTKPRNAIAPVIRGNVLKALKIVADRRSKTIPEVIADEMDANGVMQVLSQAGRYIERDTTITGRVEHNHRHALVGVSATDGLVERAITSGTPGPHEELVQDRPVLPAPVRVGEA